MGGGSYYKVDMSGHNIGLSWGSAYSTSKVFLGSGHDVVQGNIGIDIIHAGAGNDRIGGGAGNDELFGGDGDDVIYGDEGSDVLHGGNGNDVLNGGSGDDVLIGGAGRDKLIGGSGNDEFRIGDTAGTRKQADVILDFGSGDDTLSFGNHVETVYVKRTGKDTILKNGTGADAEIYAVLKNYTDPLTAYDAEDGVVFVDIV